MLQQKSKKIFVYIFLLFFIGTFNNKNLNETNFLKIQNIDISGLSEEKNLEVLERLEILKIDNLFLLKKLQIEKLINSFNYIENYSVFKKYPSSINIKLNETNYLAYVTKDNMNFYLGSNKKFIKVENDQKNLPFIFGNFDLEKFFELKKIIDELKFDKKEIKNYFFFPSGRWDLEMNSGILLKLSRDELEQSLKLSIKILKAKNNENLKIIDLRQTNQVIINE